VTATWGGLSLQDLQNISHLCDKLNIQTLIGLLIEHIYESTDYTKLISPVAIIDTRTQCILNYSWDFPLELVLLPRSLDFMLYVDTNCVTLTAGPRNAIETIVGTSVEKSLAQFREEADTAGEIRLADHYLETLILPANEKAGRH
jgi:hypothetical protein